ncbi:hypothetical protein ACLE20_06640 [Rhizobium sp. YIM 134829]|uniref:hypothetical protein n=1 Tax=Rhizobium sp. YIM 134829 TaxID=3390453 RepID=UPI00397D7303
MQPVKEPKAQGFYEGRAEDCQEAIASKLQMVTEAAMHAGWSRDEIRAAFCALSSEFKDHETQAEAA